MTQTDQQNVPKLRFPGFEENWESKTLGDLCDLQAGKFVRATDIQDEQTEGLFRCYGGNGLRGYVTGYNRDGTFPLVGRQGALCGNVHLVSGQFHATEHAMVAEPRGAVDTSWLYHQLGRMNLNQYSTGLAQPGLSADVVKQVGTKAPTLPEQRKIASFLGAVDTKIAQLAEKKRLLEDYKKGCMQQLFSQKIRFKDEDGNEFPDWEEKRLGEVGKTFGGLTGKTADDFGTGARFVTYVQVFRASQIYPEQCGFVEISAGERQNKIQRGDIIFTTSSETPREVGFASVVNTNMPDTYLNSFCFGLRPHDTEALIPEFSRYLFRSEEYRTKVIPLAQGSTRYNLSKTSFLKIKLHIPHPDEQRKIADFLSALDRKIDLVGRELTHARTFKQGLLQQMFV